VKPWLSCLLQSLVLFVAPALAHDADAERLYEEHWPSGHRADRVGGMGPALLAENLGRVEECDAHAMSRTGRAATRMPGFDDKLNAATVGQIAALAEIPRWEMAEIRASQVLPVKPGEKLLDKPVFEADPLNLFIVVELAQQHVTLLDGDSFEPIVRFPTRPALRGEPQYSPDGRYVYFASREGWISKYDIWNLRYVAEIRAGIETRNVAVSGDGRYVMVANFLPHTLVVLDAADLTPLKVIEAKGYGGTTSRVAAVYDASPRQSFIATLEDLAEVWEITYDENAKPVYEGLVHDFRMGEGIPVPGPFPPRRIRLDDPIDDIVFDPEYIYLIGKSRGGAQVQVIHLDGRRRIATVDLPGIAHLGSGITWEHMGGLVLATPNRKDSAVSIVDMQSWKTIKHIETVGPGFFLRSHENTRYAWTVAMRGNEKDTVQVIDKSNLEVVKTLRPAPGRTAAHVEFTRDGKYALVSVGEMDGALVVYDAETLTEVQRLPMMKPSGTYNVHNTIKRSKGASY
jgi:DNA-binding beta-propeller fold protein YncE